MRYRLEEPHYLDNRYFEAGSVIDWTGAPSRAMVPVDQEAADRKRAYDVDRPHRRPSRDLPARAAAVLDSMRREPGQPRPAGPPGQPAGAPANPDNPERTIETVENLREFREQEAKLRDEVAAAEDDAAGDEPRDEGRQTPAQRRRAAARARTRAEATSGAKKGPSKADKE